MDMILTGRGVDAAEALAMGLANRVVPKGQARQQAEELAAELAKLPQECMRSDRLSALHQWGSRRGRCTGPTSCEHLTGHRTSALEGAGRFAAGAGRLRRRRVTSRTATSRPPAFPRGLAAEVPDTRAAWLRESDAANMRAASPTRSPTYATTRSKFGEGLTGAARAELHRLSGR